MTILAIFGFFLWKIEPTNFLPLKPFMLKDVNSSVFLLKNQSVIVHKNISLYSSLPLCLPKALCMCIYSSKNRVPLGKTRYLTEATRTLLSLAHGFIHL